MNRIFIDQRPAWTPAEITTNAWYDASDLDTIITSTETNVTQWNDKSSNNAHARQTTGSLQPATGIRILNGKNVINFTYGKWMETISNFSVANGDFMLFIVADPDNRTRASNLHDSLISMFSSTINTYYVSIIPYSTTEFNGLTLYRSVHGIFGDPYTLNPPYNGPSIYGFARSSGGNFENYVDGTDVYFNQSIASWEELLLDRIWLGRSKYSINTYITAGIAEIVVIQNNNSVVRQKIEGYLAWKWGLVSNLSSGHPYKNTRPLA